MKTKISIFIFLLLLPKVFLQTYWTNYIYEFMVEDEEITIMKYVGQERNVRIPEQISGKPVKKIGDDAFSNSFTSNTCNIQYQIYLVLLRKSLNYFQHSQKVVIQTQEMKVPSR